MEIETKEIIDIIDIKETKICTRCHIEKNISEFVAYNRKMANGRVKISIKSHCKECDNKMKKEWRENNPDKVKEQKTKEKKKLKETVAIKEVIDTAETKICALCKIEKKAEEFCYKKRPQVNGIVRLALNTYCRDCVNIKSKEQYYKDPEKTKEKNHKKSSKESTKKRKKEYRENNKDKLIEYNIAYYANVKDTVEYKEKRRIRKKNRRKEDPIFRIRENISNAILKALKKGKTDKAGQSILQYLGYTIPQLKEYLQSLFDINMNWQNYGKYWHIDHIIPQSDLPYTSMQDENFKKCWALSNLRPLEAKQNIIDGVTRARHKDKNRKIKNNE
jgi:hypothetical protein